MVILTSVFSFRYLGRMLSSTDDDWTVVERNLWKARGKRGRLAKILGRDRADRIMVGRFYVALLQAVILFGSKTWVLTLRLEKALEGFHHRAARQMAGMGTKHHKYGTWVYPPIGAAL